MLAKVLSAAACSTVALFTWTGVHAAVTVLGSGPAQECFQAAEFGGEPNAGIDKCTEALDTILTPRDRAATLVNRGVLRLSLHQDDRALGDIDSGIAIAPDLADAFVDRGAVSIALGHYAEALEDLNKGIALGPHRPQVAYYDRAIVFEQQGDIRAAYNDYKKALDIEPGFEPAAKELKRFRVVEKTNGA
ncbi:MAG TPA: tetratricopeptide repeat protein [Rhizomicrobium sp.]|nr:tetratricopeptide repeat protein [Rhizomicrobium sp.]